MHLDDRQNEKIYAAGGNVDLFAGYNRSKQKYGIELGGSVGKFAYEGKYGSISVDFLTAKLYFSYTDGKLKPDIGFGLFDICVTIDFKAIFGY